MFGKDDKQKAVKAAEQKDFEASMEAAEPAPIEPVADDILTPEEIAQIRADAAKKVADEIKAARRKRVMADAVLDAKIKAGLVREEDLPPPDVPVTIDVAEYADRIVLDFKIYLHGHTYMVTPAVAQTLYEIMSRTHRHQDELDGKGRYTGRKRDMTMSAKTGRVTNAAGLYGGMRA